MTFAIHDGRPFADHLDAARAGSAQALGHVLDACRQYLLLVANQTLPAELHAKVAPSDVVQDSLLEAHRDFDRFHGGTPEELRGWLRQILLNNALNATRRFRDTDKRDVGRELPLAAISPNDLATGDDTPGAQAVAREREDALDRALAGLPDDLREVLRLRYEGGLPFDEVGRRLGCSADAAWKRWRKAVSALSEALRDRRHEPV